VKIVESFLWSFEHKNQAAASISSQIVQITEAKGLALEQCRRQGYDGASNMSGAYSGIQTRIREKQPKAAYIHCPAHNLNLLLTTQFQLCMKYSHYRAMLAQSAVMRQ